MRHAVARDLQGQALKTRYVEGATGPSQRSGWRAAFVAVTMASALSASPSVAACHCDCDQDGSVTIDELLTVVAIAQGVVPISTCAGAAGEDGGVHIDDILVCVGEALTGCPMMATATPTPIPTASPSPSPEPTTTAGVPPIPTTSRELLAWLQAGHYRTWTAESVPHPSGGPHGPTAVRTFLNDTVLTSLQAGNSTHPTGAAVVKELYSGTRLANWAVEIKVQDDSAGGAGWYWWEGSSLQGFGLVICTGCHGGGYRGYVSKDFVLTPFPLQ